MSSPSFLFSSFSSVISLILSSSLLSFSPPHPSPPCYLLLLLTPSHLISYHLLHLISTPSSLSYYPIPSYLLYLIIFISSLLSHRYYFSSNLIIVFPSHSLYLISFHSFLPFPSFISSIPFIPSIPFISFPFIPSFRLWKLFNTLKRRVLKYHCN